MKVQCSCGAKYEFELTAEMGTRPVRFVCAACGVDASDFVDELVRRELGQTSTPSGVPVPVVLQGQGLATTSSGVPEASRAKRLRTATAAPNRDAMLEAEPTPGESTTAVTCSKHPDQVAAE